MYSKQERKDIKNNRQYRQDHQAVTKKGMN